MENTTYRAERSVADLIRDLREETTTLLKQEVALAKTEMSEKAAKVGRNVAYLAIGGLVAYAGLMFILLALSALAMAGFENMGLSESVARWLGPAVVGIIIAIVGYALIYKAKETLANESLAPEKTIQSLKEDKQWTQEKLSRA
jgi:xanthine/uracil permease